VVKVPVHPASLVPLLEIGRRIIWGCTLFIKPHHDASHVIDNGVGTNRRRFRAGAIVIGDIVDLPLGVVAPAVIRAANRISLDMFTANIGNNEHRTGVFGEVSPHMFAIRVKHHRVATFASVKGEVTAEKGNSDRAVINLPTLRHDEPSSRIGVGAKAILCCCCHGESPVRAW
jgi:hypothetical protein